MNIEERKVMKLALEALEYIRNCETDVASQTKYGQAAKAIKEALAQPEQEPVAWSYWQSCLNDDGTQTAPWVHRLSKFKPTESIINKDVTPLYTTPLQRKPLTDEMRKQMKERCDSMEMRGAFADGWMSSEAAHGIKEGA